MATSDVSSWRKPVSPVGSAGMLACEGWDDKRTRDDPGQAPATILSSPMQTSPA